MEPKKKKSNEEKKSTKERANTMRSTLRKKIWRVSYYESIKCNYFRKKHQIIILKWFLHNAYWYIFGFRIDFPPVSLSIWKKGAFV